VPDAGEASLDDEDAKARPRDYLEDELASRFATGPAGFTLELELAQDGDPVEDPTAVWPGDRERVVLGRLDLERLATGERERDGDVLVFDPTRLTDGIELTDDPVIRARSAAYRTSVARRTTSADKCKTAAVRVPRATRPEPGRNHGRGRVPVAFAGVASALTRPWSNVEESC
jgi:catalase